MSKVALVTNTPNAEETIVEIARVSSKRTDKKAKPEGLINYLIKHKHWSPFEHASMTLEIETSKAIGIQLIRHRSFTFQEFSQRYQDVNLLDNMFEPVELRKQAEDNRQSSTETFNPEIKVKYPLMGNQLLPSDIAITSLLDFSRNVYNALLDAGVARETARMILPLCTNTKIYMTGTLRSWIHFFELRDDEHAQKEIQDIAKAGKEIFVKQFPVLSNALGYIY
jgi:thymidylate synthase (FAD)